MGATDPVGELVLLSRSAADAEVDWRTRLRREWLPRVVATVPSSALVAAIAEWQGEPLADVADITAELEAAVVAAMAEQGYD